MKKRAGQYKSESLQADAGILGRILAAQNMLFVLPSEKQIAEFFVQTLSEIPGHSSCTVCLGKITAGEGSSDQSICNQCGIHNDPDAGVIEKSAECMFSRVPDTFVYPIETMYQRFGFFIFNVNNAPVFGIYKPFLCNLANFIALTMENRLQRINLLKSQEVLESKVEARSAELQLINSSLLKKSEELELYFNHSLDLLCIADTDGYFRRLNPKWESTLGCSITELENRRFLDFVHPEDLESTKQAVMSLADQKEVIRFSNRFRCKDGTYRWIEWNSFPSGKTIYAVARDVTEGKEAEQARQTNLHFLASLDSVNRAMQGTDSIETMMSRVLELMLSIFDCDRAFMMYPCDPDSRTWKIPMEKNKPEYPGAFTEATEMPMDEEVAETLKIILASETPVKFGPGTPYPLPEAVSQKFKIKSFISMAIYPKLGTPWQFGMHQCSYARIWSKDEERLFQEIGRRLSDSLSSLLAYSSLKESEAKYRRIIDTANEGIWMLSVDSITISLNRRMAELLGYLIPEIMGKPFTDFLMIEDIPDHQQKIENRRRGISETYERRLKKKDGGVVWTQVSAVPILDDAHNFIGSFAMFTDISERKRNENINSARLHLLQFASGHGLDDLLEESLNEAEKLTGSLIGFYHFIEEDQKSLILQNWSKRTKAEFCKAEGKGLHYNISEAGVWVDCVYEKKPVIHNNYAALTHRKGLPQGHAEVVRELIVPVLRNGMIKAILGVGNKQSDYNEKDVEAISLLADLAWEVAERKRSDEALFRSEERFRRLAENARDLIFRMSLPEFKFEYVSPAVNMIFGYQPEELYINPDLFQNLIQSDWLEFFLNERRNILNGTIPPVYEYQIIHKTGELRWINQRNILIRNSEGVPVALEGLITDITERKRNELELRRLTHAIEQSPVSVIITDASGNIQYVNPKFTEITGYTSEESIGRNPRFLKSGETDVDSYRQLWLTITSGGEWHGEFQNKRKNGELFWEAASISAIRDHKGTIKNFVAIKEDITEKKRIERKLKESEEQYRILVNTVPDTIIRTDLSGNIVFINETYLSNNLANENFIGRNIISFIIPEERESVLKNIKLMHENKIGLREYKLNFGSYQIICEVNGGVLRDSAGNPNGMVYILRDITARKKVEKELENYRAHLEELIRHRTTELQMTNKLLQEEMFKQKQAEVKVRESLAREIEFSKLKSKFMSIASHEFRTPLAVIYSSTELLQRYGRKWSDEEYDSQIERVKEYVHHMTDIMDDMLTISRAETGKIKFEPKDTDLEQLCIGIMGDLSLLLKREHRIDFVFKPVQKRLRIDEKLIKYILINLLSNAIKYSVDGGVIQFKVRNEKNLLIFEISDQGIGIPEKDQAYLFEPFHRGENVGDIQGTGLGMSIIKRSVEMHNGTISFKSKQNSGTSFTVKIPILNR